MANQDPVKYHLRGALLASIAESARNENLSRRLHAEVKQRLISMSDEELWELAKRTADPPVRPVELVYEDHKREVEKLRATSGEWMGDLLIEQPTTSNKKGPDKILIIVNELTLNSELASIFDKEGFSVACIPDYPEALLELCGFKPDMVILDEDLPGFSGIEACSELHSIFGVPVILLGADSSGQAWARAVEAGADFYLVKPFDCDESLVARVRTILRRYKGRQVDRNKGSSTTT